MKDVCHQFAARDCNDISRVARFWWPHAAALIGLLLICTARVALSEGDFSSQVSALQAQIGQISAGPTAAKKELDQNISQLSTLAGNLDAREKSIPTNETKLKSIQSEAQSARASADQLRPSVEKSLSDLKAEAQSIESEAQQFNAQCSKEVHVFQLPAEQAAYDACVSRKSQLEGRQQTLASHASAVQSAAANYDNLNAAAAAKEAAATQAASDLAELKRTQESDKARFQSLLNFSSKAYQQLVAIAGASKNLPSNIEGPGDKPGNLGFDDGIKTGGGPAPVDPRNIPGTKTTGPDRGEGKSGPATRPGGSDRPAAGSAPVTRLPASDPLVVKQNEANEALRKVEQNKQADPAELRRAVETKTKADSDVVWKRYQEKLRKGTVDTTVDAAALTK